MSKQYMDFAPRKASKGQSASQPKAVRTGTGVKRTGVTVKRPVDGVKRSVPGRSVSGVTKPVAKTMKPVSRAVKPASLTPKVAKSAGVAAKKSTTFSVKKEPVLGVIEDLNPKFVNTNVPKRPLSSAPHFAKQKTGVAAAKAKKIGVRGGATHVEKYVENSKKTGAKGIYSTPKSPFINQTKVQKRPLSKNVYQKKIVVPKEEPQGPVTIISKPEKQAHVGLIVTIILTIILGAAAGTVAFLLLPK